MTELLEQQDELIFRYLRQQLGADERAQFEIRMLEEPELLERVQLLEALGAGLAADRDLLRPGTAVQRSQVLPFTAWIRQPLSLAASLLLAVALVFSVVRAPESPELLSAPVGSLVLLDGSRSDLPTSASGNGPYLLQIDAGLDAQASSYDVVITREADQQRIAEERGLTPDGNGWIRVLLDGLPPGVYTVAVTAADAQGAAQTRSYRVQFGASE